MIRLLSAHARQTSPWAERHERSPHMKQCNRCREWKSLASFNKDAPTKDGLKNRCKVCVAADKHASHAANPGPNNARSRAYRKAHPVERRAYNREWKTENTAAVREYRRKYYETNRATELAANRKWVADNPEAARLIDLRRAARKKENGIFFVAPEELRYLLSQPCYLCGGAPSTQIDHIIPVSRGGRHSIGNLLGACKTCNCRKHAKFLIEYRAELTALLTETEGAK